MVALCSAAVNGLSIAVANPKLVTFVMFCVNIGLILCAVIQATALVVLYRKTACASVVGLAAVMVFGMSAFLFVLQLLMYVYNNADAVYAISFCLCLTYAAFITSCVYSIMLSRNSHKKLCILTGVLDLIPPIGVVFTIVLSYKINRDTTVQEYVYRGYAYTYAALGQFCAANKASFTDLAGAEELRPLGKREIKSKLKDLKRHVDTAEGQYAYAAAIATYTPEKSKKAVKYMKQAADGNHASALFNIGYYYELGAYLPKDFKKAKSYYTRAADAGDADAELRLGILEIKSDNAAEGFALFKARAETKHDGCAKYNMGVCYELGVGVEPDIEKALDLYVECDNGADKGGRNADIANIARRRIFALAATDINSSQNGDFFRKVTDRPFKGEFRIMLDGLIEIKKRHAADAADCFLKAVKKGGVWEGLARCLVGTLYIDCGKELKDKCNGAEYIKSALDMMPDAKHMYSVIPASILKEIRARSKANKNKQSSQKQ